MGIFNFPKQNNERNVRESNLGFFFYIRNVNLLTCIKGHINVLILSECRPGFFGMNCLQTCAENYFGNLCENKCDCNETQICHDVCGCIRNSSMTDDSSTSENVTSSYFAEACSTSSHMTLTSQSINYCLIFSFLTSIDLHVLFFITYLLYI